MAPLYPTFALFVAALLPAAGLAHPGHDVTAEIAQRAAYMAQAERRSLSHCAAKLKERGIEQRSIARRQAHVEMLRKKRSLKGRDIKKVLNTSHHSTEDYNLETPPDILFAGKSSCILSPEVTEGPYCAYPMPVCSCTRHPQLTLLQTSPGSSSVKM
jgi:hypothetical protein